MQILLLQMQLSQFGIRKVVLLSAWWQRWGGGHNQDSVASKLNQRRRGKVGVQGAAEKGGSRGGRGSRKGLHAAIDKLTMASTLHIRPLRPLEADKFQIYSTSTTGEVDLST